MQLNVLVADDEPMHAFLLEMFLKKWGHQVESTDSGVEALRILREEQEPCVAILDWQMPGLTGVELCREVKRIPEKWNIFILLLTARAQKADKEKAMEAGVDAYMTKPYEPEELRLKLENAWRVLQSRQGRSHQRPQV